MNRLKKKAVRDFWTGCVVTAVGLLAFGLLTWADIKGVRGAKYLLTSLFYAGLVIGWMFFQNRRKQKQQVPAKFDEREFSLIIRAINIGNNIFIAYVLLVMIVAFYLIGGRGRVPMWTIPLALFLGLFLAGTIQFCVLMHHAKEDDTETERGGV